MSEKAKAAVVMVSLEKDECVFVGSFEDDGEGLDPRAKCEALWESLADDWPGWEPTYVVNEGARELMASRRMWQWGVGDDGPMASRIAAHNAEVEARDEAGR